MRSFRTLQFILLEVDSFEIATYLKALFSVITLWSKQFKKAERIFSLEEINSAY